MDETMEEDVVEEIKEEVIPNDDKIDTIVNNDNKKDVVSYTSTSDSNSNFNSNLEKNENIESNLTKLKFNDVDLVMDTNNNESKIEAPKSIERLEEISEIRALQRKLESDDSDDSDNIKLNISEHSADLNNLDIHVIDPPELNLLPDLLIDDIEILD
jgi:hypothetical protein